MFDENSVDFEAILFHQQVFDWAIHDFLISTLFIQGITVSEKNTDDTLQCKHIDKRCLEYKFAIINRSMSLTVLPLHCWANNCFQEYIFYASSMNQYSLIIIICFLGEYQLPKIKDKTY